MKEKAVNVTVDWILESTITLDCRYDLDAVMDEYKSCGKSVSLTPAGQKTFGKTRTSVREYVLINHKWWIGK